MEKINLLYIDDQIDFTLSDYLDNQYAYPQCEVIYEELEFTSGIGYEALLKNEKLQMANVVIIDSMLFEDYNAASKFTGEEFKIIIKKFFPYIETIVITQNLPDTESRTISKYNHNLNTTAKEYYDSNLKNILNEAIKNVFSYRKMVKILNENANVDSNLRDKIVSILDGENIYDELTKSDIDELINTFKMLQEKIDG